MKAGNRTLLLLLAATVSACTSTTSDTGTDFRPTATVQDVMDALIDPSADEVWESVATVVDINGIHEHFPQNDDEWTEVRRNILRVIEGSNLLLIPGRLVAEPGVVSENPDIELDPEEIAELISDDRETWVEYAHNLHDAAMVTLDAVNRQDVQALLESGEPLDRACEGCHIHYWYPNDSYARQLYEERLEFDEEPDNAP